MINDLTIDATRTGDHVKGTVTFVHGSYGRSSIPIDYRSVRPDASVDGSSDSTSDKRDRERFDLVQKYMALTIEKGATLTKKALLQSVCLQCKGLRCSTRTLQIWVKKYQTGGPDALREKYVRPIVRVLTLSSQTAEAAVHVCAWWGYRIGNIDVIGNKVMAIAVDLIDAGYGVADVIAVIECYFAWPTDRKRYPFKTFQRWVKYDFQKWLLRAAESNDRLRALDAASKARRLTPDPSKMRRRQVNHRSTRCAIRSMSNQSCAHQEAKPTHLGSSDVCLAAAARSMRRACADSLSDAIVNTIDTGITPIAATKNPQTIAESLAIMDDGYRRIILEAASGDVTSFNQAASIFKLWWKMMPESIRNNIDAIVDQQIRQNPHLRRAADRRRLSMLISQVKRHRAGCQRIGVAARLPA